MQRRAGKPGKDLGKSTGWIHRNRLAQLRVHTLSEVRYHAVRREGIDIEDRQGRRMIEVDHVVVCAGQMENTALQQRLLRFGLEVHVIGGASKAAELDAQQAIEDGVRLGQSL